MKKWIGHLQHVIKREIELIRSSKSKADAIRLAIRFGILVFLVAFKWVIPISVLALIRLFTN